MLSTVVDGKNYCKNETRHNLLAYLSIDQHGSAELSAIAECSAHTLGTTVAWGLLKGDRWCMIVVRHWSKPAWQNMAFLLMVVGLCTPHNMP